MQYKIAFVVKLSITYFKWDNKPRRLVGAKSIHAFLAFFHGLYFLDTNGTDCAIFNLNAIGIAAKEHRKIKLKNNLNNNELKREIGLFSITVLVIANMVGTGIFTTSGFIIQELENPQAMLICWLVGGVFALCGALFSVIKGPFGHCDHHPHIYICDLWCAFILGKGACFWSHRSTLREPRAYRSHTKKASNLWRTTSMDNGCKFYFIGRLFLKK